jgi:hypothetical protein
VTYPEIISWLLSGDVSIQYQTHRDLLDKDDIHLRNRIATEGWGQQLLSFRQPNGHWGRGFYQPKWISSHYTLLELKYLNPAPENKEIAESLEIIFDTEKAPDGGLLPIGKDQKSDVCVNGMVLNYASYFRVKEEYLKSLVDFLLNEQMNDGGFNCFSNRGDASHSSLHTTLSVVEGIAEYKKSGYSYRLRELEKAGSESHEFILSHKLYRSDKNATIIRASFLQFCYPPRWYYDILKAMDYFQLAGVAYDSRMEDALQEIGKKRTVEGIWKLPSHHAGKVNFIMEKPGQPSRWNTLRALRVLKHFNDDIVNEPT